MTPPFDVLQRGVCADAAAAHARSSELVCQRQLEPDRGLGDVELGAGRAHASGAGVGVVDAAQLSEVVARVARCRKVAAGCFLVDGTQCAAIARRARSGAAKIMICDAALASSSRRSP
jgi:hypothetical protein